MLTFTLRRLLLAIPTLLFISLVIFLLLEMSPGDPLGDVPRRMERAEDGQPLLGQLSGLLIAAAVQQLCLGVEQ